MGWIISIALLIGCIFSKEKVSLDVLFLASALFAIAGAGGSIAASLATKKKSDENKPVS